MTVAARTAAVLVAPYAVWMALMAALPPTAAFYAVRVGATLAALVVALVVLRPSLEPFWPLARRCGAGAIVGAAVFAAWVLPEALPWYRHFCIASEGGTVGVETSSAALLVVRLLGSALVISVAEELFFRRWLVSVAGFWWTVALFAVEHDRWLAGAVAGIAYGLVARRFGLASAIVAHAVTNFLLGVYVLLTGSWQLW